MALSAEDMLELSASFIEGAETFLSRGDLPGGQLRLCTATEYLVASSLRLTPSPEAGRTFLRKHGLAQVLDRLYEIRLDNPGAQWCDAAAVMDALEGSALLGAFPLTELVARHVSESLSERFAGEYARGMLHLLHRRQFQVNRLESLPNEAEQRVRETYLEPYLVLMQELSIGQPASAQLADIRKLFQKRNEDPDWSELHSYFGTAEDPVQWDVHEVTILSVAERGRVEDPKK